MYKTLSIFDRMLDDMFDNTYFVNTNYGTPKVTTKDDNFEVELALPGFTKKEVNVEVEGRRLTISADVAEENETYYRKSFKKVYSLPDTVNPEDITAKMENGILSLSLAKTESTKKIKVA